jgi:Family of unknown function (DUF6183)
MSVARARDAITANDLDELVRVVDAMAAASLWDELLVVRDLARRAFDATGRQMWPAASWAEYLIALRGPAECVAEILTPDAGFFAPGPLAEVAAQHHAWTDLRDVMMPGPTAALFAHERATRGEPIDEPIEASDVLAVPLARPPWEPHYVLPEYRLHGLDPFGPDRPSGRPMGVAVAKSSLDDAESVEAIESLRLVVAHWAVDERTEVRCVAVDGDATTAIATCANATDCRVAPISPQEALIWMAWAAASDGGVTRRRGGAAGRDAAWHAAAVIAGFEPDAPYDPHELGEAIEELQWWWWTDRRGVVGHVLQLAVEDPVDHVAFAISAVVDVRAPE